MQRIEIILPAQARSFGGENQKYSPPTPDAPPLLKLKTKDRLRRTGAVVVATLVAFPSLALFAGATGVDRKIEHGITALGTAGEEARKGFADIATGVADALTNDDYAPVPVPKFSDDNNVAVFTPSGTR